MSAIPVSYKYERTKGVFRRASTALKMADTQGTEEQAENEPPVKILIADKNGHQVEALAVMRDDLDCNQISRACVTDLGFSGASPPLFLRWRFPAPLATSMFPAVKEEFAVADDIEFGQPEVLLKASADQYMASARRGSLTIVRLAKTKSKPVHSEIRTFWLTPKQKRRATTKERRTTTRVDARKKENKPRKSRERNTQMQRKGRRTSLQARTI